MAFIQMAFDRSSLDQMVFDQMALGQMTRHQKIGQQATILCFGIFFNFIFPSKVKKTKRLN